MKTIKQMIIVIFALFGISFLGLMAHEAIHIIQSREPISVCWDFQQQTVTHVLHNTSAWPDFLYANNITTKDLDGYSGWMLYSEKWAGFFENLIYITIGILVGILIMLIYIKDEQTTRRT